LSRRVFFAKTFLIFILELHPIDKIKKTKRS